MRYKVGLTTLTFTLTRIQLEKIRSDLATKNINLVSDTGDINYESVQLHFAYVESKMVITIADSGHWPMFIVKGKITNWFKIEEA